MVYHIRYFDIDWYLMFTMIVLRLLVDGSVNCYILVQMDEMLISSRWDYPLSGIQTCYYINSCYWKLLRKYCQTVTHALFYCSTIYMVILSTLLLLHYWYCYCHRIVPVIEITWILSDLNNNIIDNLHWDWENWWRRRLYFGWT